MNARAAIAMSDAEVRAFLEQERTMICATVGTDGWPHLMPLWYVLRDGECWAWTYAKSQKVRNLERESRCTLQVAAGTEYLELRGVMMKCVCAIHRDPAVIAAVGTELGALHGSGGHVVTPEQAAKRVALQFISSRVASWDHRKLAAS